MEKKFLVSKFSGILKKYARKLNYEDAEQDLTADFIELIHHIDIEKLNNTSDGAIVNFLIRSTYHYYVKRLQKERDRKVPEVYFEDLTPSQSNLVIVCTKKHINNRRQIWHKIISFRLHCLDRSVKI